MSYQVTAYRILIASPNDVASERKTIPEVISSWNATHSEDYGVALMPVMWETHSTPEMGERPQSILNKQIVACCDFLIGTFWTRIGTHTGVAESGSVEEIEEFMKAGKPVLLYFSSMPVVPESVDQEQYSRLKAFRDKCQRQGITESYSSIAELREKLNRHLTQVVRKIHGEPAFATTQAEDNFREVGSLKDQLQAVITRAEADWSTERDIEPVNTDEAKSIIEKVKSDLLDFEASLEGKIEPKILHEIVSIILRLKKLESYEIYMDGGQSYREFWGIGNEIFASLNNIIASIHPSPSEQHLSLGINEEKIKILKLLANLENNNIENIEDSEISNELRISLTATRYHLKELEEQEYIYVGYVIDEPPFYNLAPKGRGFLIKNKLI